MNVNWREKEIVSVQIIVNFSALKVNDLIMGAM